MNTSNTDLIYSVVDTLPSGLILTKNDGDIIKLNQRASALLGLDPEAEYTHLDELPGYLSNLINLLKHHREDVARGEIKLNLAHKAEDDQDATIGFGLKVSKLGDDEAKVFTFTDITQILRDRIAMDKIKDELNQSRKLASIGTMISGVAHELNNPLTGISMSAELARMNVEKMKKTIGDEESPIIKGLDRTLGEIEKINKNSKKASVLVGDLLSYSRPSQLELEPTTYKHFIQDILNAINSHPNFSEFTFDVAEVNDESIDWPVMIDRVRLEQVFYNLFKNACEATEGKGTCSVTFLESISATGQKMVTAQVKDNGPGIDKSVLERIFDPFFSTKGNKGVGLGLSISYRTVEQHGGLLSVDSDSSTWTAFKVMIPVYNEDEDNRDLS